MKLNKFCTWGGLGELRGTSGNLGEPRGNSGNLGETRGNLGETSGKLRKSKKSTEVQKMLILVENEQKTSFCYKKC